MLPNFTNQTKKAEFMRIRQEVDRHLDYANNSPEDTKVNQADKEELENRIFHFIDVELGSKRTPSEARIYKKLIKQLNRTKLLNEHYIKALEKKANRFLDKRAMRKEKDKIKSNFRDSALLGQISHSQNTKQAAQTTKSEHVLSSDNGGSIAYRDDSQSSSDHIKLKFNQASKAKGGAATSMARVQTGNMQYDETDSYNNFGDVDDFEHASSDAGRPKLSASSTGSQKPHFLIKSSEYLTGYKERVLGE